VTENDRQQPLEPWDILRPDPQEVSANHWPDLSSPGDGPAPVSGATPGYVTPSVIPAHDPTAPSFRATEENGDIYGADRSGLGHTDTARIQSRLAVQEDPGEPDAAFTSILPAGAQTEDVPEKGKKGRKPVAKKAPAKKAPVKKGKSPAGQGTANSGPGSRLHKPINSKDASSKYDTFEVPGVARQQIKTKADKKASKKINVVDAAKAFRNLANMLSVDKNEIAPVDRIAKQYKGTELGTVFARMRRDMADQNLSFGAAFAKHGKVFPQVVVGLVSVGAQAGKEPEALVKAAQIIQDNAKVGRRVRTAVSEPLFTLVLTILFLFVVLFGIIPQFKGVFDALGKPLPTLTQILMNFSTFMMYFLMAVAAFAIFITIMWKRKWHKDEDFRVKLDTKVLNLKPKVLSELLQTGLMSQLFGNLAILRSINMNERNSLVTTARSTSNWALRKELLQHARRMEDGESTFGQLANNTKLFPTDAGYMLTAGEDSGRGTATLQDMAASYKEESELAADQFVAQVGPIANSAVGVVYMFVMLASYLPVFEMYTDISAS